jgi:hypothetical protein
MRNWGMPELPDLTVLIGIIDTAHKDSDVLDRITAAEDLVADLGRLGDRLIGYYVEKARAEGHSWSEIGAHLGVSRQAAQQRYTPLWSSLTLDDLAAAGAFTRFTERTKETLSRAEAHARDGGHGAITVGHLLLGILDDQNTLAVKAIRVTGADPAELRQAVRARLGDGTGDARDRVPIGASARRCLEAALTEALELGHNYIGTEHLLLGILRDRTDVAAEVLRDAGVRLDAARTAVRELLAALLNGHV